MRNADTDSDPDPDIRKFRFRYGGQSDERVYNWFNRGPVWAKTREQLRKVIVEGKSPVSGKPALTASQMNIIVAGGNKQQLLQHRRPAIFTDR
jgi:hypothetical protein